MKDLAGRSALLTGASGGLGPVIARRLKREGVRLVLSARNRQALDSLAAELGDAEVVPADLAVTSDVEHLAQAAAEVDILVANAALTAPGRLLSIEPQSISQTLRVNLEAPLLLARALGEKMAEPGSGHLVFLTSIASHIASTDYPVYTATKFGLRGFALALRQDFDDKGIGVSMVSPTFVSEAGMWAVADTRAHPLAGEVKPEQVADAVVKAIKGNRTEVRVMPMTTTVSTRIAGLVPEVVQRVAAASGAAEVPREAIERQREKEAAADERSRR